MFDKKEYSEITKINLDKDKEGVSFSNLDGKYKDLYYRRGNKIVSGEEGLILTNGKETHVVTSIVGDNLIFDKPIKNSSSFTLKINRILKLK